MRETVVRRPFLRPNRYGVVVLSTFAKCGTVVGETKINYSFVLRKDRTSEVQSFRRWELELWTVSHLGRVLGEASE